MRTISSKMSCRLSTSALLSWWATTCMSRPCRRVMRMKSARRCTMVLEGMWGWYSGGWASQACSSACSAEGLLAGSRCSSLPAQAAQSDCQAKQGGGDNHSMALEAVVEVAGGGDFPPE